MVESQIDSWPALLFGSMHDEFAEQLEAKIAVLSSLSFVVEPVVLKILHFDFHFRLVWILFVIENLLKILLS